jgi:hypothetical protein
MTKKHFKRIAQALRLARGAMDDRAYAILVAEMARACSQFNLGFNYDRFRDAAYEERA